MKRTLYTFKELVKNAENDSSTELSAYKALEKAEYEVRDLMLQLTKEDPREKLDAMQAMADFCFKCQVWFRPDGTIDYFEQLPDEEDKHTIANEFYSVFGWCRASKGIANFSYRIEPVSLRETVRIYLENGEHIDLNVTGDSGLAMINDLTAELLRH